MKDVKTSDFNSNSNRRESLTTIKVPTRTLERYREYVGRIKERGYHKYRRGTDLIRIVLEEGISTYEQEEIKLLDVSKNKAVMVTQ